MCRGLATGEGFSILVFSSVRSFSLTLQKDGEEPQVADEAGAAGLICLIFNTEGQFWLGDCCLGCDCFPSCWVVPPLPGFKDRTCF